MFYIVLSRNYQHEYWSLGEISAKVGKDHQNYTVSGGFEQLDDQTILINELPVGKWTTDYKQVSHCI